LKLNEDCEKKVVFDFFHKVGKGGMGKKPGGENWTGKMVREARLYKPRN